MRTEKRIRESGVPDRTTSLGGRAVVGDRTSLLIIMVSGGLSAAGTSSSSSTTMWEVPYVDEPVTTASGPSRNAVAPQVETETEATRKAVSELRRISGLTWEQLAGLFQVSRRSVHFWASGKPLNAGNHERLMRVLDVVRAADRGSARSTREALLDVRDGATALDLLTDQRFREARAALGRGRKRRAPVLTPLSAAAQAARRPLPPEELFDAKSDRVHHEPGRARAARTARGPQHGRG